MRFFLFFVGLILGGCMTTRDGRYAPINLENNKIECKNIETECRFDPGDIETAITALYRIRVLNELDLGDTIFINLSSSLSYAEFGFTEFIQLGEHKMLPKFGLSGSPLISFLNSSFQSSVDSIRILKYHVRYRPGGSYFGSMIFRCVDGDLRFVSVPERCSVSH